jgi:hypothetical protein
MESTHFVKRLRRDEVKKWQVRYWLFVAEEFRKKILANRASS